jgi:2-polyprenyl-6-methoxyphenol hydroxylase-like FAD-dependent oxidoreductase
VVVAGLAGIGARDEASSSGARTRSSKLTTAVVGAGPAGLLFTLIGKISMRDAWLVEVFDKRETYLRTHRLRMAPEPYRAIQQALDDPRFDALVTFLEEQHFSPEVNLLEAKLAALLAELGVQKTVREITALDQLRADTIVGADSVHSTIRELVRGPIAAEKHTHERVARLRVTGPDLPARLGVVDQYRLSKVLGSVVDYRRNANGFAEIDLFLTEDEHALVHALGASPKDPVPIDRATLANLKAPLFRAIIEQLDGGERRILLQSTFLLEHAVMPRVSFSVGEKRVFLVGDAAVSLPFFRGMACLASCAHALARAHASGRLDDYEGDVAAIVKREIAVVRSRAHLVRGLRELVRVSSLLPFPIQSWWLSAARDPLPDRLSPSGWFNLSIAVSAAGAFLLGLVAPPLALLALPLQAAGGVAYRWTIDLEPGPHRYVRRIWEVQIAATAIAGVALAITRRLPWPVALGWLVLGVAFVLGMVLFESIIASRLRHAELEDDVSR